MEEGRCGWYGIDDAICMERSAAARLRYGIPFKRVCFNEHSNVLLVFKCKSRFRVKSLHLLVALFDLFARPRSPTPRSLPYLQSPFCQYQTSPKQLALTICISWYCIPFTPNMAHCLQ